MENWRYQEGVINEDEYAQYFLCKNCGEEIHVFIKKGTLIKDIASSVICEYCGVEQGKQY